MLEVRVGVGCEGTYVQGTLERSGMGLYILSHLSEGIFKTATRVSL